MVSALTAAILTPPWLAGRTPLSASRTPITFPTTNLTLLTRIAPGADLSADPATWSWSEISEFVRWDGGNGIGVEDGRRDGSGLVTTTTARMMLDNRDGRFSRRNPASPYFGQLSTRTPIWVEVDPGDGGHTRLEAFVESWPVRWPDESLNDCYVLIECAGIMRYLQQSPGDAKSAALRSLTSSASALSTGLVAYWPLEDLAGSRSASTPIVGARAATVQYPKRVTFGERGPDGTAGAALLVTGDPVVAGADNEPALLLQIPDHTPGELVASFWFQGSPFTETAGVPEDADLATAESWLNFDDDSTIGSVLIRFTEVYPYTGASDSYVTADAWSGRNTAGVEIGSEINTTTSGIRVFDGGWHQVQLRMAQSGGDVSMALLLDGTQYSSQTLTTQTLGTPYELKAATSGGVSGALLTTPNAVLRMSAVTVHNDLVDATSLYDAGAGYPGEQAHERIERLCLEEGVLYSSLAVTSEPVGVQSVDTLLPLLREAEAVDLGVLYEKRWGLAYQSRTERYNRNVALSLGLTDLSDIPAPADDNERTRNKWTVYNRNTGANATAEETTGPMGTGAGGPGELKDSDSVSVAVDEQLPDQASWRVHLGTVDEDRWPNLEVGLHRSPELIDEMTTLDYGARTQVSDPPDTVAPQSIDALVEGRRERINQRLWDVALNTSQAWPYTVAVYGPTDPAGAGTDHYDALDSSTAAAFVSGTDTSMSVTTTSGPLWTVDADDFPFNIEVFGVVLTVTTITGASSPQTFTITQTPVNGVSKTIPSGKSVVLHRTPVYAL